MAFSGKVGIMIAGGGALALLLLGASRKAKASSSSKPKRKGGGGYFPTPLDDEDDGGERDPLIDEVLQKAADALDTDDYDAIRLAAKGIRDDYAGMGDVIEFETDDGEIVETSWDDWLDRVADGMEAYADQLEDPEGVKGTPAEKAALEDRDYLAKAEDLITGSTSPAELRAVASQLRNRQWSQPDNQREAIGLAEAADQKADFIEYERQAAA